MFTVSSSRRLPWPRSFGLGLTKLWFTVDKKVFVWIDSNVVPGLLKLWTIAARTLFSIIISQTSTTWISQIQSTGLSSVFLKAQPLKCALQWCKNDLLHKRDGNFVYNWPHPTLEHLFQTAWLIADKLFVKVSAQVLQQPSTYLDWNVNLKWKRQSKIWWFSWPKPIISHFGSLQPSLQIT